MEFTATHELEVRKALATTASAVSAAGYIKPSAHYFSSSEEFWATTDVTKDTRAEIDAALVGGLWIYPVNFLDDLTSGCADSPLMNLRYEFYLFRQYAATRSDETDTPDVFDAKVLYQHNQFIQAWIELRNEFLGSRNLSGYDAAVFATLRSNSLVQIADIANQAVCEFIPNIIGYAVRMQTTVHVQMR